MRTYTSPSGLSDANTAYGKQAAAISTPGPELKHAQPAAGLGGDESLFDGGSSFEGTSSLTAQTAFASDFVELVVSGNTPRLIETSAKTGPQSDMQRALEALCTMAQQQQDKEGTSRRSSRLPAKPFPRQKPVPRGGVCQLPMPPMDVVLILLREIRAKGWWDVLPVVSFFVSSVLSVFRCD